MTCPASGQLGWRWLADLACRIQRAHSGIRGVAARYGDQAISQFRGSELIAERWDISPPHVSGTTLCAQARYAAGPLCAQARYAAGPLRGRPATRQARYAAGPLRGRHSRDR